MASIRNHRRWINRLYRATWLLVAIVWATGTPMGSTTGMVALVLLAFSIPSSGRNLRRSEHRTALSGAVIALLVVLFVNRAWVVTPLMLAIWVALATFGTVAWLLRPAVPPVEEERELVVGSAGV